MEQNRRVLVAMSGGVDSSAAVCLLKEQGYACVGVTMKLLGGPPGGEEDAREAARRMGIPHYVLDCAEQFRREVVQPFADAYERGETPNPCVFCNRALKFGLLLDKAEELGCAYLATGHYARITDGGGGWRLRKAADLSRDQSYVLYPIPRQRLGRVLFPLGGLSKDQVREIAARAGFPNARKQDSQDICFIPDGDYLSCLERQDISRRGHCGYGREGGGPPPGGGGAHPGPAPGGGGILLWAHLCVRQVHGHQHRHRGAGGGAVLPRLRRQGLELAHNGAHRPL